MDKVRIGLVGTSWWADLFHLPCLQDHPHAHVAALCGRSPDRAQATAAKFNVPQVYTDYREMFAQVHLDGVIVSVPDDAHHPLVMAALDAGLHVLCEKPLALTLDEARSMYDRAAARGVKHMTMFTYRAAAHYRHVAQLVADGYIGRPLHASFRYCTASAYRPEYRWRYDAARSNGILGDLGSHMIDMARWYVGEISRVSARLQVAVPDKPGPDGQPYTLANDTAYLTLDFANGAAGTIHVTSAAHPGKEGQLQQVFLYGSDGMIEIRGSLAGVEVRGTRRDEPALRPLAFPTEGTIQFPKTVGRFHRELLGPRLFADAMRDKATIPTTFHDGWKVQAVMAAAVESDQHEGRGIWV